MHMPNIKRSVHFDHCIVVSAQCNGNAPNAFYYAAKGEMNCRDVFVNINVG